MNAPADQSRRLELPAERFFWAILDASVVGRALPSRQQLGYLFEHVLPLSIDEVQAVYRRLPGAGHRYVACGMEREKLNQQIEEIGGDLLWLSPAELPDLVRHADPEDRLHAHQFNLLSDDFEPSAVRRARRRWLAVLALLLLAAGALLIVGLSRRTEALLQRADDLREQQHEVYEKVLVSRQLAELPPGLTPERLLTAEVRQLRRTRSDLPSDLRPADAGVTLASFLSAWPRELEVRTESVVVSSESIEVRALLPTGDDVQRFSDALERLKGWDLKPLETRAIEDGVRAILRFATSARAQDRQGERQ